MNTYITGSLIKRLREEQNITQQELANKINVSEKTISKWETNRGFPDISLVEALAAALKVSLIELFNGKEIINKNKASNILKTSFYVCPICRNVLSSTGEGMFSCCGNELIVQEAQNDEKKANINISDDIYVEINSPMTKNNYISFISYVTNDTMIIKKLYPEQKAEASFLKQGHGIIYYYDIKEGLYMKKI